MRKLITLAALAAFSLTPLASSAIGLSTKTTSLAVSMTVVAGCSAISATPISFGLTVAAGQAAIPTGTGTVSVTCATGVSALLGFNAGSNATGLAPTVALLVGPAPATTTTIGYTIYSDVAHTFPFPVVTAPTTAPAGGTAITGTGSAVVTTVYGSLNAVVPTGTPSGVYNDSITATLYY